MAACDGEPVKAAECEVLAFPIARDRTRSSEKGKHLISRDLLHAHVPQCTTKRLKDACFRVKAHAHPLPVGDVGGHHLRELHDSSPRSNAATSRSPARS